MDLEPVKHSLEEIESSDAENFVLTEDDITQEYELGEAPADSEDEDYEELEMLEEDDVIRATDMEEEERFYRDDAAVVFEGHQGPVYSVDVNPVHPDIVVTGSGDDTGKVWNCRTGEQLFSLEGHTDTVGCVGFSSDGSLIATSGFDSLVKIWCANTGKLLRELSGPSMEIEWLVWHQKGPVLFAGSADGTAWLWLASTGACMNVFAGHEGNVTCGVFTSTGKMAVTGSEDGTVRLWNPKTGVCNHTFRGNTFHEGPISTLVCHPSQPIALTGSQDGTSCLIHLKSKKVLHVMKHGSEEMKLGTVEDDTETRVEITNSIEAVGFSTVKNWCATGCLEGELRIWDLDSYQCRHICSQPDGVLKLIWHPTELFVFTAGVSGIIRKYDARTGECVQEIMGNKDMVLDIKLSFNEAGDGVIIAVSDDETARVFSLSSSN